MYTKGCVYLFKTHVKMEQQIDVIFLHRHSWSTAGDIGFIPG